MPAGPPFIGPTTTAATAAIILAAGASRRMGSPKALLPWPTPGHPSFVSHILATLRAAGVSQPVVVIGPPHGEAIRAALMEADARLAWNPHPERGMLSSVQAALPLLPAGTAGTLVWPVDMPSVQLATLQRLLTQAATTQRNISFVVPTHEGRGGHPIWVARQLFGEVLSCSPELGLRALRQNHRDAEIRLPVADAGVLQDADTPEALAALYQRAQVS